MSRQREYHRRHDWEWSWSYESNQLRPRTLDKNAENSLMWRTLERKKWAEKGKETSTQHKKFSNFSSSFSPRLPSSLFLLIVVLWWHRLAESSTTRNFPSSFTGASSNIQPIMLSLSLYSSTTTNSILETKQKHEKLFELSCSFILRFHRKDEDRILNHHHCTIAVIHRTYTHLGRAPCWTV